MCGVCAPPGAFRKPPKNFPLHPLPSLEGIFHPLQKFQGIAIHRAQVRPGENMEIFEVWNALKAPAEPPTNRSHVEQQALSRRDFQI